MDVAPTTQSSGTTVVLLHGKNFSGAYWARTISELTTRGHRVVVPDQLGFGKSDKPERFQYSFEALAESTHRLLESLGVERAALVGHSMGGMLAARYALMYPAQVSALILVNPIGLEDWQQKGVPYRPIDELYANELQNTPEKVRAYMKKFYFGGNESPELDPLVEIQAGWMRGPDRARVAWNAALTTEMVLTQPVVHAFGRIAVPTLLLIGQADRTAIGQAWAPEAVKSQLGNYPELGRAAAAAIPGAKLVELPEVGHVPQVQVFEEYIKHVMTYLVEHP